MDETPEQKYDRLQREIQNAILTEYPNPERNGCPGRSVVESFAKNPDQITVADDRNPESKWHHITHCSPCYAEFLEMRTAYRVRRARARTTRRAAILSALGGVGVAGWLLSRNQTRTVDIDFEKYMSSRGVEDGLNQEPLKIPTGKVHFRLRLPKDSAAGVYSVRLSREPDSQPIFETAANAISERDRGMLIFDAEVNAVAGVATLGIRNDHRGVWRYCLLEIKNPDS